MGRAVMAFKEHLAQRAVAVPKGQQEGQVRKDQRVPQANPASGR